MALTSIGDTARHFATLRQGVALRDRLATLSAEMSGGTATDPAAHLAGRADRLAAADRSIALYDAGSQAARILGQRLDTAQQVLEGVARLRSDLSADLIATPVSASLSVIGGASARAAAAFSTVVSALNSRYGSESLFAGTTTDRGALAPAGDILAAVRAATAGVTDAADLVARVDAFFADGSGFHASAYLGDTGSAARRRIDGAIEVSVGPRADDVGIRAVLSGLALAALAADPGGLDTGARAAVLRTAGERLITAADGFAATRAALGAAQEQTDAAATRLSAALSASRIARAGLVALDPAETATHLTQVQDQLEAHYTVTARLSGLSLAGFLR